LDIPPLAEYQKSFEICIMAQARPLLKVEGKDSERVNFMPELS
jgi:hypothetical protein